MLKYSKARQPEAEVGTVPSAGQAGPFGSFRKEGGQERKRHIEARSGGALVRWNSGLGIYQSNGLRERKHKMVSLFCYHSCSCNKKIKSDVIGKQIIRL